MDLGRAAKFIPLSVIATAIIGLFYLERLDWVINNTLYDYGLIYSSNWSAPYSLNARALMLCLGIIAVIASILPFILWRAEHRFASEKMVHWKAKSFLNYKKNILALVLFTLAGFLGIVSVVLNSVTSVMAALGLTIWGIMLLLLTTQKVVRANLVDLFFADSTIALDSLLSRFGYDTQATIYPPVSTGDNPSLQISRSVENKKKMSFTPLGLDLVFQIEKKSPIDLFSLEFDVLTEFLSKMFLDELEIATGFAMSRQENLISVRMIDFVFHDLCRQIEVSSPSSCKRLLCPVCSSLACVISKATHKSVSLNKMSFDDPHTIEICFEMH